MINTILFSKDDLASATLKKAVEMDNEFKWLEVISEAKKADKHIDRLRPDLILLDLDTVEINSEEFTKKLSGNIDIIILSKDASVAAQAFDIEAIDFLIKPLEEGRIAKSLVKARQFSKKDRNEGFLFLKDKGKHYKLDINDILYIQSDSDYLKIFTNEKRFTILHTLGKMLDRLKPYGFIKVHKSFIVDMHKIETLDHTKKVVNIQNVEVPFSRRLKTTIIKQIKGEE